MALFIGAIAILIVSFKSVAKKAEKPKTTKNSSDIKSAEIDVGIRWQHYLDSINIITTSRNIETVLSRYDFALETLTCLTEYEISGGVIFEKAPPSEMLTCLEKEKANLINAAIQRAYDDMVLKVAGLKTEKGRINHRIRFFEDLNLIVKTKNIPPETQYFIADLNKQKNHG